MSPNLAEGPPEETPRVEETEKVTEAKEEVRSGERRRRYVKLPFGLPESNYDTLKVILRAMGKRGGAGTPLTLQEIAESSAFSTRTVSSNNKFLLSTGLATKSGNNIYLTERGAQLALAVEYDDSEDAGRAWRAVAAENDFFQKILSALDVQGGMKQDEFAERIARNAQAPKKGTFMAGARAIVDILLESGLVAEDSTSGKLMVTPDYRSIKPVAPEVGLKGEADTIAPPQAPIEVKRPSMEAAGTQITLNVRISIDSQTTADDIEKIASRIRELREKLR